jgi:hypothetical protein
MRSPRARFLFEFGPRVNAESYKDGQPPLASQKVMGGSACQQILDRNRLHVPPKHLLPGR